MKTVIIVQARMGSSRLPGKIMHKICGHTVLWHVINRLKHVTNADEIVIATTIKEQDDVVVVEAKLAGVSVYRGSESNVLERYYEAAKGSNADVIVRVTSDCPMIEPRIISEMIDIFVNNNFELVTNASDTAKYRTFPRGLDCEVFSFKKLEESYCNASRQDEFEHVTTYLNEHEKSVYHYMLDEDLSHHRWTLDTPEDLSLITEVYKNLFTENNIFSDSQVYKLMDDRPEIFLLNAMIEQKSTLHK